MSKKKTEIETLWERLPAVEGIEKLEVLSELSHKELNIGHHSVALALCENGIELSETPSAGAAPLEIANFYRGASHSLRHLKRYREAAIAAEKSSELASAIDSTIAMDSLDAAGDNWYLADEYEKSFQSYLKALNFLECDPDDESFAYLNGSCGYALGKLKRWEESLEHFLLARKIFRAEKNLRQVSCIDQEISLCYYELGNVIEARRFANYTMDFAVTTNDDYHLMWAHARMGLAQKLEGAYEKALESLVNAKALMVAKKEVNWGAVVRYEYICAEIKEAQGDLESAQEIRRRVRYLEEIVSDEEW